MPRSLSGWGLHTWLCSSPLVLHELYLGDVDSQLRAGCCLPPPTQPLCHPSHPVTAKAVFKWCQYVKVMHMPICRLVDKCLLFLLRKSFPIGFFFFYIYFYIHNNWNCALQRTERSRGVSYCFIQFSCNSHCHVALPSPAFQTQGFSLLWVYEPARFNGRNA